MKLQETKTVKDGTVISVYMPNSGVVEFRQDLFCMSDIHYDSIFCDRVMLKRDLDRAKANGAWIVIAGDLFDAMQAKRDPRGRRSELRQEYADKDDYFNTIVEDCARFLEPYQENILMIGYGNHEDSVIRHNDIDVLALMVGTLNAGKEHKVQLGGYGGWIRFMYQNAAGVPRGRVTYKYNHGSGGAAPVTKGAIQTNRQAASTTDADITHNGHNHNEYVLPLAKENLNGKGQIEIKTQLYIRTPGYKNAYEFDRKGTSWERQIGSPTTLGSVYVTMGLIDGKPAVVEFRKTF